MEPIAMPHIRTLSLAVALALPGLALAQDAATELDEVVVTSTRTAIALEDSLAPAQVIDRADIERSQATSLQDLLRGRAGINLTNAGGPGKQTSLFLRGTNSSHTLVLIDGVRVNSADFAAAAIPDLPLAQIERIEIVRGPNSSLYGSEAIGGVIQIFTRRNQGAYAPHFQIGGGSNGLRQASAVSGGAANAAGSARMPPTSAPTASMPAGVRPHCSRAAMPTNRIATATATSPPACAAATS